MNVIIDFETLDVHPSTTKVIEVSAICFDMDKDLTFNQLINQGINIRFDLKQQKHRTHSKTTVDWWKLQSDEAKKILIPTGNEVSIKEGINQLLDYMNDCGIDRFKSLIFCRGASFDFPLLSSLIMDAYQSKDILKLEPVAFRNQRDIRTYISAVLMSPLMYKTPLPIGVLDGFVMHNSLHDCAKDIIMMQYANKYALGLLDPPDESNTIEDTLC